MSRWHRSFQDLPYEVQEKKVFDFFEELSISSAPNCILNSTSSLSSNTNDRNNLNIDDSSTTLFRVDVHTPNNDDSVSVLSTDSRYNNINENRDNQSTLSTNSNNTNNSAKEATSRLSTDSRLNGNKGVGKVIGYYERMKIGWNSWKTLSKEVKEAWHDRARLLNRRRIPGLLLAPPNDVTLGSFATTVFRSMASEWAQLVGMFRRAIMSPRKLALSRITGEQ